MARVRDIVTGALRRLSVIAAEEDPSDADADRGLKIYNQMLFALKGQSIDVNHSTQTLNSNFVLGAQHEQGVECMLAVAMAGEFGVAIPPKLQELADAGDAVLAGDYMVVEPMSVDRSMLNLPNSRRVDRI